MLHCINNEITVGTKDNGTDNILESFQKTLMDISTRSINIQLAKFCVQNEIERESQRKLLWMNEVDGDLTAIMEYTSELYLLSAKLTRMISVST